MIRIINPIENNLRQRSFIERGDSCFLGEGKRNDFWGWQSTFSLVSFRFVPFRGSLDAAEIRSTKSHESHKTPIASSSPAANNVFTFATLVASE
jgi:hypothetical protein